MEAQHAAELQRRTLDQVLLVVDSSHGPRTVWVNEPRKKDCDRIR